VTDGTPFVVSFSLRQAVHVQIALDVFVDMRSTLRRAIPGGTAFPDTTHRRPSVTFLPRPFPLDPITRSSILQRYFAFASIGGPAGLRRPRFTRYGSPSTRDPVARTALSANAFLYNGIRIGGWIPPCRAATTPPFFPEPDPEGAGIASGPLKLCAEAAGLDQRRATYR